MLKLVSFVSLEAIASLVSAVLIFSALVFSRFVFSVCVLAIIFSSEIEILLFLVSAEALLSFDFC